MQLEATLTKDDFWNEMMEKYPKVMKVFCAWIDEYKKAVNWEKLFGNDVDLIHYKQYQIKFHDIPYAMQYGIWMEFCSQNLHKYFEQAEHWSTRVDLAEDIKSVFKEVEELIDEEEDVD